MLDHALFYKKCLDLGISKNIYVSYSGGIDSSVLLHLVFNSFSKLNYKINIISINHSYSENSNKWSFFCKNISKKYGIDINIIKIKKKTNFTNIEEFFRKERYKILSTLISEKSTILLGHNKDDFIETFLFRLFRGSGVVGLSSINIKTQIFNLFLLRPLLTINRKEIEYYAYKNNIFYLKDNTNYINLFDRNYIRNNIIPSIKKKWKNIYISILKYSVFCIEISRYLFNIIKNICITLVFSKKYIEIKSCLNFEYFLRNEILRHWIKKHITKFPTFLELIEINKLLLSNDDSSSIVILNNFEIKKYKTKLYISENNITINEFMYLNYFLSVKNYNFCLEYFFVLNYFIIKNYICLIKLKNLFQKFNIPYWERKKFITFNFCNSIFVVGIYTSSFNFRNSNNRFIIRLY